VAFDLDGAIVQASDLQATGAMMVLLKDTIMPNLVQTTEHTPALIHAGPFGNIAHGTSSVIAQRLGLQIADYVVNEAGFGADLGAEKFLDIVMPSSSLHPSAAVLVATVRGIRHQSGGTAESITPFKEGLENLAKHVENLRKFRLPTVVALNCFPGDSDEDVRVILEHCVKLGVESAITKVFDKGSEGGIDLAQKVLQATDTAQLDRVKPLYSPELAIEDKITLVAKEIYGARAVIFTAAAKRKLEKFTALGFSELPACMAKTQYSLSDDPKKLGAPQNFNITVTDAHLASGAGFIVVVAGNMMLMPGLPKSPQAMRMSVQEDGSITGMI